eukprot:1950661-Rhodomonas_salina.1
MQRGRICPTAEGSASDQMHPARVPQPPPPCSFAILTASSGQESGSSSAQKVRKKVVHDCHVAKRQSVGNNLPFFRRFLILLVNMKSQFQPSYRETTTRVRVRVLPRPPGVPPAYCSAQAAVVVHPASLTGKNSTE